MDLHDDRFQSTDWTEVLKARTGDDSRRRAVLNDLSSRYWKPVYCYLRRKGHGAERAKDLTQGFFCDVVLGRRLVERADPAKGRFRTFVLKALGYYVSDVREQEGARKRIPAARITSIDALEAPESILPPTDLTAEQAFVYGLVSAILDEILAVLESECRRDGLSTHWEVFRKALLEPIMQRTDPPPMNRVCEELGIPDASKATNMIVTVKRRFRSVAKRHARRFVTSDAQVDDEILCWIEELSRGGAS